MRWSIQELFKALKLYRSHNIWRWFIELPYRWIRRTGVILRWLFKGYTISFVADSHMFLAEIIVDRLKLFKKHCLLSYPHEFESVERWRDTIDLMIVKWENLLNETYMAEGFNQITQDLESLIFRQITVAETQILNVATSKQLKNNKEALSLFTRYFEHLWH